MAKLMALFFAVHSVHSWQRIAHRISSTHMIKYTVDIVLTGTLALEH